MGGFIKELGNDLGLGPGLFKHRANKSKRINMDNGV